ncbi:MAG: hypothetical protein JEZ08_14880 [Clostridiales bacterium]|nr:hypothetical protein [Clostridiales bacterium]
MAEKINVNETNEKIIDEKLETAENLITDTETVNTIIDEAEAMIDKPKKIFEDKKTISEEAKVEVINEPVEKPVKIKKYLEKPLTKKERRIRDNRERKHEKAFNKRVFKEKEQRSLKVNIMIGLLITFGILMVFKYVLNIDMTVILNTFLKPSIGISTGLIVLSFVIILTDRTNGLSSPDPITDYFIINRGKIGSKADKTHMSRINSRFIMVTLLKLFKKDQIAIINERIIYGTMDGELSKDEVALLNFMLDHNITSVNEFVSVITEQHPGKKYGILGKKDHLYGIYKEAILTMAKEKHYINQSINKAKLLLRSGAVIFGVIVIALVSKGQGTIEMIAIYGLQAIILFMIGHYIHAHSQGAHHRIAQLRKEKKLLQSNKADVYTAFIYNYLFKKEAKSLKRIQKLYETGAMSPQEYTKFSETYNGFNYILDTVKLEK